MPEPERGALLLVRVVAVALIGFGAVNVLLYYLESSVHQNSAQPLVAILRGLPALVGIGCLIKSKMLAAWLSDWLDL